MTEVWRVFDTRRGAYLAKLYLTETSAKTAVTFRHKGHMNRSRLGLVPPAERDRWQVHKFELVRCTDD